MSKFLISEENFKKINPPEQNCTILLKKLFPQFDEKPLRSHRKTQFFQKINPEIIIFCLIFLGPTKVKRKPDLTKNRASNFVFWKFLYKISWPWNFFWNEKLNQNLCAMFWSKFFCFVFFPNAIITFFTCHIIPNIRANFPVKKLGLKPHHFTLLVFLRMYVACKNIRLGKNYYYFFLWFNPNCPM